MASTTVSRRAASPASSPSSTSPPPPGTTTAPASKEVVTDYPLADAIAAGIVKQPVLGELSDPREVPSDDASVQYRQWIDAGVARLKDYEELHGAGKRPILFIMAGDTKEADQVARYLESLDGFRDRVLTIHTNTRGEISEAPSGKNKEELERLRRASREVDSDENPYRAIVSVMMLREGRDVRKVTVIVGLRPYSALSGILPEQTVGRGLRLMYGGGSGANEQVDVLGTPKFEDFVKDLKQTDNVEFKRRRVETPLEGHAIKVEPDRIALYHILIPQLSNLLRRSETAIGTIDVTQLGGARLTLSDQPISETQIMRRWDVLSKTLLEELELDLPLPRTSQGILWYYATSILKEARVPKTLFDQVVAMVKQYLTHVVFGRSVDLGDLQAWWRLMQDDARAAVVTPFVRAINRVIKEEAPVELREPSRLVSQTPAFVWGKDVYEGRKTVFHLVPLDSDLERAFAAFMDRADDVAAYAMNTKKLGLSIDYQSDKGHFRMYEPDFIVCLVNGDHWLIETKGLEDLEVRRKDARARHWCQDATELTADTAPPQHWQYARVNEDTFKSHQGRTFDGLIKHALATAPPLLPPLGP